MSNLKLFDKWDTESVSVDDPGLKDYINLKPIIIQENSSTNHRCILSRD